jgi:putative FmdB family regulatory protein
MPIYEFKCVSCGKRFERLCSIGDSGEKLSCPKCGAAGPSRVMSGFSAKGTDREEAGGSGGSGCGGCTSTNCGSCGH